jgi:hypothetical protein
MQTDGDQITLALLTRLDSAARRSGCRVVAIALGTNGRIGNNARLSAIVGPARQRGTQLLDLAAEMQGLSPEALSNGFRPRGHYSPAMNIWVGDRVAAFIRDSTQSPR